MPVMDGYSAGRAIKRENENIIVIGCSAFDDYKTLRACAECGMDGYISKPVKRHYLKVICDFLFDCNID